MKSARAVLLALVFVAGCKTVVTTTTEMRPTRFAVLEFTRPVSHDSIVAYAKRAVAAENLKIQSVDDDAGHLSAGPVRVDAKDGQPQLDASVTISSETRGAETKVRIFASAAVERDQLGGHDARLMELVQRIERRLDSMIGH